MLSKAQIKHISALRTKKYRTEHAQFIVEGKKSVDELLKSNFEVLQVYFTSIHENLSALVPFKNKTQLNDVDFGKISQQKNPEGILAIATIPTQASFQWKNKPYIALDSIRDPGNLGTIIRLADWFGAEILCSHDCVELYNTKVIQASMGSLFHTPIHYIDLAQELSKTTLSIYVATLAGQSIYDLSLSTFGVLVIGNEAHGISEEILALSHQEITIPNKGKAESLNAAMACGILASYLFR